MQVGGHWEQLSYSSKAAMQWAWAAARHRTRLEGGAVELAEVGSHDLLVGLMVAHPVDSEPLVLLRHFGLGAGQALPGSYPRPKTSDLERELKRIPAEQLPPLDSTVEVILDAAVRLGLASGDGKVSELRALAASLFSDTNETEEHFSALLRSRGADPSRLLQSVQEFVQRNEGQSYAEYLVKLHPFSPSPVDLPNYKADQRESNTLADDFLGIGREVDAFAYLIASRGLLPPLAIGLFGDWGSGKSFFMQSVQRRVEELTKDPVVLDQAQSEVPFWKRIVQIRFNAWHYVGGNLWASLVNHVFEQLRLGTEGDDAAGDAAVRERREHWLQQLDEKRVQVEEKRSERREATLALQRKQQEAEALRAQHEADRAELRRTRAISVTAEALDLETLLSVREDLSLFVRGVVGESADQARRAIDEASRELKSSGALVAYLRERPARALAWMLAFAALPMTILALLSLGAGFWGQTLAGLTAGILGLGTAVNRVLVWVKAQQGKLLDARRKVDEAIEAQANAHEEDKQEAARRVEQTQRELAALEGEQRGIEADIQRIEGELERLTPARMLQDFVAERVGSDDYRAHLGVPALIQRDFRRLSRLIGDRNDELGRAGAVPKPEPYDFNRIVLYIDDLDRCSDAHVVEVLQAVHLLLAFDLFVVVVAVDSRWLSHALEQRYPALVARSASAPELTAERPTPEDYLEKIFQVPFWVRPLDESGRRGLVRGLLRGHQRIEGAGEEEPAVDGKKPEPTADQARLLDELRDLSQAPTLQASALTLSRDELAFLDGLAPLLGRTPRSVKRFVNLYQLVRVASPPEDPGAATQPPRIWRIAFVLAVIDGLPKSAASFFGDVRAAPPAGELIGLLPPLATPDWDAEELERLRGWLGSRPEWSALDAERLTEVFPFAEQLTFAGRVP